MKTFKQRQVYLFALLSSVLAFGAISCDGSSGLDCDAYCQRSEQCCDSDPGCDPWDNHKKEDCLGDCSVWSKTMTDAFLEGFAKCHDLPCDDEDARMSCINELYSECTDDISEQVTRVCNKRYECLQDMLVEECVPMQTSLMRCYTKEAVDAGASCSDEVTCDNYIDEFKACFEEVLGITF